jgi:hypothetical protein
MDTIPYDALSVPFFILYLTYVHKLTYAVCVIYVWILKEYTQAMDQLFVDMKKVYDSVRKEVVCAILIEFGIPLKLVSNK